MGTAIVTGASRGLGAGVVRRLLADGHAVVAACRDPARAAFARDLDAAAHERLHLVALDVDDEEQIAQLPELVADIGEKLDLLVNNAGTGMPPTALGDRSSVQELGALRGDALMALFRTNAVAPVLVTQALRPLLVRSSGAVVANLTSVNACFTTRNAGGHYGYRASKAALNMITATLAADLRDDGITVIGVHPGWVRTDMGGQAGDLCVDEAVEGIVSLVAHTRLQSTGLLFNWQGHRLGW